MDLQFVGLQDQHCVFLRDAAAIALLQVRLDAQEVFLGEALLFLLELLEDRGTWRPVELDFGNRISDNLSNEVNLPVELLTSLLARPRLLWLFEAEA